MLRPSTLIASAKPWRAVLTAAAFTGFALYVGVATLSTLFAPISLPFFLAPLLLIVLIAAPEARAIPQKVILPLVVLAAGLMPFWPVYIHLKIGALPLLTPPRLIFYILTAIWLYDMAASPLRRGHFISALQRWPWLSGFVLAFFALNALSVPLAEGSSLALQAFFRQIIILFLPFCIFATYVRRIADFKNILIALVVGATLAALIATAELASGTLLAAKLAPFIMTDAQWLQITQEIKSRDGVFRAQSTHTHPISLGEYLGFCAPLAIGLALAARNKMRALWIGAFLIVMSGLLATNSRGAVIAIIAGMGLTGVIMLWRFLRSEALFRFRPAIGLLALSLIAASPVVAIGAYKFINGEAGTSAARSSQGRIEQIEMAWPKIVKRPVLGYGAGRSARIVGYYGRALSLDNYYLSLAVELGFPGPICFFGIIVLIMRASMRGARYGPARERWIMIGFIGAMAAFATSRLIISQTGNLSFFFPLIGAFLGAMAVRAKQLAPAAPKA